MGIEVRRAQPPRTTLDLYRRLYGDEATRQRPFYNLGAGGFRHEAWTNVDHPSDHYHFNFADNPQLLAHDLQSKTPLPIEAGTARLVYTSHCIEHIDTPAAAYLFRDVHRVLVPGGVFRITAPDMELFHRAYERGDRDFFDYLRRVEEDPQAAREMVMRFPPGGASVAQMFLSAFASSVSDLHADGAAERISDEALARMFAEGGFEETMDACVAKCPPEIQRKYPHDHINWWTEEKLVRALRAAGFATVYRSAYGQSAAPPLRDTAYFDSTQPWLSVYVEAVK